MTAIAPVTQTPAAPSLSVATTDQLAAALRHGGLGEFEAQSDYAACLMPLLHALGWRGDLRRLSEALPHFSSSLTADEFINVLAEMDFKAEPVKIDALRIDPRLLPCLLVPGEGAGDGKPKVLLSRDGETFHVFDSATRDNIDLDAAQLQGTAYFLAPTDITEAEETRRRENWIGAIFRRFRPLITQLFVLTLVLNVLSLAVPLFIMALYNQVIPMHAVSVLGYLMIGLVIVFTIETGVRVIRSRMIAFLGGRIENIVASATFRQILSLPPNLTEAAPIGSQVARLREFDSIRELFTGPLVSVVLELPFTLLFLLVIWLLAGPLALIPIVMMALFAVVALLLMPSLKRAVGASSKARAERHGFLVEMITNMRTIREAGVEKVWSGRYRERSANAAYNQFRTSQVSFLFQSIANELMFAAGIATIAWGVVRVVDGDMSIGGLIATMALIWRVLSPLQNLFLTLTRFGQVEVSVRQINQLMRMPIEEDNRGAGATLRRYTGAIAFSRVSFRYQPTAEPAILGANFQIQPGELVAIMGSNGSGKSTILKLVAGMYRPQAGQVTLDGLDIRQINPLELRQALAYVPQQSHLFHGTIAQNLRLADPTASAERLREACERAGVLTEIDALADGLETRIGDQNVQALNSGFRQRLSLARAYVKKSPVTLLDEPAQTLDDEGDATFVQALLGLKGQSTILMVSHRPSHIRLCDKVIVMKNGVITGIGTPDDILGPIPGAKS